MNPGARWQWAGGVLLAFAVGFGSGFALAGFRASKQTGVEVTAPRRPVALKAPVQLAAPSVPVPEGFANVPAWEIEEHGTPERQLRAALAWAERVPPDQIPATLRELDKHRFRDNEPDRVARAFLSARWAEIDPEAAAWECRGFLRPAGTRYWIDPWSGLAALAATNPFLAVDTVAVGNVAHSGVAGSVVFEVSRKDPGLAWQLYETWGRPSWAAAALVQSLWLRDRAGAQHLAGELRQRGALARLWAGEAPAEAFRWATDGTVRKDDAIPLKETADQWALQDLAACRAHCEGLPVGLARDAMLAPLTRQIGRDVWRAGADWLLAQAPSHGRTTTLAQLLTARTSADPEGVSTLLRSLPASDERDTFILGFVQKASQIDPAGAMDWIGSISDPRKAANLADHQFGAWIKNDATAATEWLRTSTYATPAMKAKWLKE